MKLKLYLLTFFLLSMTVLPSRAQVVSNDTPIRYVSSLPTTCSPTSKPQVVVYKYTATRGLYYCSAPNTWTAVAGGSAGITSLANTYSNSLATAISTIGSTKTTLLVDADTTCSTALTIPATLILKVSAKAKITKTASCTINFQGIGLDNPESQTPVFSGFASGNITWTTADHPASLSVDLWDGTDLMAKIVAADAAMSGLKTTLVAHPGDLATLGMTLHDGHNLHFVRGDYTVSCPTTSTYFFLESNTHVYGDGRSNTKIHGSSVASNDRVFTASGMNNINIDGYNEYIEISDLTLLNDNPNKIYPDTGASAINLGNCVNCHVHDFTIKDYPAYGVYIGAFPTAFRTFTDANVTIATGNLNIADHQRTTGSTIQLSTTGTLPVIASTGVGGDFAIGSTLSTETVYFAIVVDANNIKLARTKALALAGTAITYSSAAGGGTHKIVGYSTNGSSITDGLFDNVRGQNVGFLNGRNIRLDRLTLINPQLDPNAAFISLIDIEPNSDDELCEHLSISNIKIDARTANQNMNGIVIQNGGNIHGCKGGLLSNIEIYGPTNGHMSNGILLSGTSGFVVQDSYIEGASQSGLAVYGSRSVTLQNNVLVRSGSGGTAAIAIFDTANSTFESNRLFHTTLGATDQNLTELETEWLINSSGSTVERKSNGTFYGNTFLDFYVGLTVNLNGSNYTINTIPTGSTITTSAPVGTLVFKSLASATDINTSTETFTSAAHGFVNGGKLRYQAGTGVVGGLTDGTDYYVVGATANTFQLAATLGGSAINITSTGTGTQLFHPVMTSVFSSNDYRDNRIPQGITLSPTGSSRILSDGQRMVADSFAPPQITVDQNDYKPTNPFAYRFDLSTSASKNITGWVSTAAYPDYYKPVNGEKHFLYNAGSFNIVLQNENAGSTAIGRFHNSTGADITLSPGQGADIEYNSTLSRWMVFKRN